MKKIDIKDYSKEELEAMEIPELEAHMTTLFEARKALREEQIEVGKILEQKERVIKVKQKMRLAQMTPAEREIAVQIIEGSKLVSDEKVNAGGGL